MSRQHSRGSALALTTAMAMAVALLLLPPAGRLRAADSTLFAAMGGEPVLKASVDRFVEIVEADDRINFTFADSDISKFKQLLYEQLCQLSGGPCHYSGRDMRSAHAKLKITTAEFNALAEDLYLALGKSGVAYRQQNRLMAMLAPMKHDIVKPPGAVAPEALAPDAAR